MESLTTGPELENSQGHFRPRRWAPPPGPLPLRPQKLTSGANEKLVAMGQQQKSAGGSADNQLMGSPAERRAFTSVSRRAGSRIVWVFSQEVIVKSGRADKKRSAVCFASSGWPFC